jgi:hypothetical protein
MMAMMTEPLAMPLEALTPALHSVAPPFPQSAAVLAASPLHPVSAPLPALTPTLRPLAATLQMPTPAPPGVVVPRALPLLSLGAWLSERIGRIGLGREPGRAGKQRGRQDGEQASCPDHRLLPRQGRVVWGW